MPLSDGMRPRRFPIVNVLLIAANFAVWILYATILARAGQRQDRRALDAVRAGATRMPAARFAARG